MRNTEQGARERYSTKKGMFDNRSRDSVKRVEESEREGEREREREGEREVERGSE